MSADDDKLEIGTLIWNWDAESETRTIAVAIRYGISEFVVSIRMITNAEFIDFPLT